TRRSSDLLLHMALHGNRLPGISRSDRGRFLPLPDHRDTSLISWHCHSMTVAGRMPARASTAVARPAYRAKKRIPCFGVSSMKATMKYYHFFSHPDYTVGTGISPVQP